MIRRLIRLIGLIGLAGAVAAYGQYATLTGTLQAANGLPALDYTLSFTINQFGFIGGTGVVVNATTYCGTDNITGAVVGIAAPSSPTLNTPSYSGGTLGAGNYFVVFSWYTGTGTVTQVSPESTAQLSATGNLQVAPPSSGVPAGAAGMNVYIGTTSGSETYQGQTVGAAVYTQSVALVTGASQPATNTTLCKQVANDAIWPIGTGYTVSLTDPSGNTLPGYPMMWQLLGPNTTINLSYGLPYYHGVVTFPVPILASPFNHAQQSISGPLSLGSYYMTAGGYGVGVFSPLYGFDAEGSGNYGRINANGGYLVNQLGGTSGQGLCSDGTYLDQFCNFLTASTAFYQTVALNGTAKTQRPVLNFTSRFTATDSSSPARTTIDANAPGTGNLLATETTNPGASTNCAQFDGNGNIAPSSTSCSVGGFTQGSGGTGYWEKDPLANIEQWNQAVSLGGGDFAVVFPLAPGGGGYTTAGSISVQCTIVYASGDSGYCTVVAGSITTSGFTVHQNNLTGMSANWYAKGN